MLRHRHTQANKWTNVNISCAETFAIWKKPAHSYLVIQESHLWSLFYRNHIKLVLLIWLQPTRRLRCCSPCLLMVWWVCHCWNQRTDSMSLDGRLSLSFWTVCSGSQGQGCDPGNKLHVAVTLVAWRCHHWSHPGCCCWAPVAPVTVWPFGGTDSHPDLAEPLKFPRGYFLLELLSE